MIIFRARSCILRETIARSPLERGASSLVGVSTFAWFVRGVPSGVRRPGAKISLGAIKNSRRHRQTQTPACRRVTRRIQDRSVIAISAQASTAGNFSSNLKIT